MSIFFCHFGVFFGEFLRVSNGVYFVSAGRERTVWGYKVVSGSIKVYGALV